MNGSSKRPSFPTAELKERQEVGGKRVGFKGAMSMRVGEASCTQVWY